jgi:hypothetical protein
LCLVFTGIVALFWYNELIYQLPTPVPDNYKQVKKGQYIPLPGQLIADQEKPVFLHFFNPDCPCSKFNINHFKSLVKEYGQQVNFVIVVVNNDRYSALQIQKKFDIDMPVSFDTALATASGVYSTPQAAILDNTHQLYYRGNYNKSRYCTDKKSNYAQIALEALLQNSSGISFDRYALTAYGCELPQCTNN